MSWGGRREIFHRSINYWKLLCAKCFESHSQQPQIRHAVSGRVLVDAAGLWIRQKADFLHFLFCFTRQVGLWMPREQNSISSDQAQSSAPEHQPANRLRVRSKDSGGVIHPMPKQVNCVISWKCPLFSRQVPSSFRGSFRADVEAGEVNQTLSVFRACLHCTLQGDLGYKLVTG